MSLESENYGWIKWYGGAGYTTALWGSRMFLCPCSSHVSPKQINTYHLSKREHGSQIESERDTILPPCSYHAFESNLKRKLCNLFKKEPISQKTMKGYHAPHVLTHLKAIYKGKCAMCSRKNPSHRRQWKDTTPCVFSHIWKQSVKEIVKCVQERTHRTEDVSERKDTTLPHALTHLKAIYKGNCAICSRKNPSHRRCQWKKGIPYCPKFSCIWQQSIKEIVQPVQERTWWCGSLCGFSRVIWYWS
jgi:hypothetical protein